MMPDYATHFDTLYRDNDDPWNYTTSDYEKRKYDATCAALTRPTYQSGIEAGCSIGVLTERLAQRCTTLVGLDLSARAVGHARRRLAPYPGTTVIQAVLPAGWPQGVYDLLMLSEIVYYLIEDDIVTLAQLVARDAAGNAECVLVQWRGDAQTIVTAPDAMTLFCSTLLALRRIKIVDQPDDGEYVHRTILFD